MNILILDDDENRHVVFRKRYIVHNIKHVYTAQECIDFLRTCDERMDLIHLDHDLGGLVYVDSREENTGYTVAKWIQSHYDISQTIIVLHSLNPVGRANMKALFPNNENVVEEPFYLTRDERLL